MRRDGSTVGARVELAQVMGSRGLIVVFTNHYTPSSRILSEGLLEENAWLFSGRWRDASDIVAGRAYRQPE